MPSALSREGSYDDVGASGEASQREFHHWTRQSLRSGRDGSASASLGMISTFRARPPKGRTEPTALKNQARSSSLARCCMSTCGFNWEPAERRYSTWRGIWSGWELRWQRCRVTSRRSASRCRSHADVRRIVKSLLDGYEVEYGYLGVGPGDVDLSDSAITMATGSRSLRRNWNGC